MQVLTYVYRLQPSRAQHAALRLILDGQRQLYNAALQERVDAWRRGVSIGMNDQTKSLTEIRGFDEAYGQVPYNLSKWTLKRLDDAMKGFFKRAKAKGGKAGFPRFRPASRWSSFGFHQIGGLRLMRDRLLFSSGLVGGLKVKLHRPLPEGSVIKSANFTCRDGRWQVALTVSMPIAAHDNAIPVGVDVGIEHLATSSNGIHHINRRSGDRRAKVVRRAQRALSRCKRGSRRRRKVAAALRRVQRRLHNDRSTHLHQVANAIVAEGALVFVEDLKLKNLTRSARGTRDEPGTNVRAKSGLNRALLDAAPGRLISFLRYKAERAGGMVIEVDPKGTSQLCSSCGITVAKPLSMRRHRCACGADLQRDHNAAINILQRGLAAHGAARRPGELNVADCGVRAPRNADPLAA